MQAINVSAFAIACAAVLIAASVTAVGLVSEAVVVLALYHERAADWTGPFAASGTIVLIGAVAVTPAIALVRMAANAASILKVQDKAQAQDDQGATAEATGAAAIPGTADAC